LTVVVALSYNARKFGIRGVILPDETEWMTIERIYEYLGKQVPMDSIRQWIRTKRLKAYKPGKAYLVKREDLDKFIEESGTIQDKDT
jgi:excisionase family DNA binding protein